MITNLLIANRGEIACRIMRTAKQMGIRTVAVYSTVDAKSLHVQLADDAYFIGESPPEASYLNIEAIIAAAKAAQVDAIHPGYGFLSENLAFAQACQQANLIFVGPSVEAIEQMGSKDLAKKILAKEAVPLIPGYHGENQSDAQFIEEAMRIGFPLLIKPAAGGGGKGMRIVAEATALPTALAASRREAKQSFGDQTLILEKYLQRPKHIEVQILADAFGSVLAVGDRDCSIQRRHQKIIEEAGTLSVDKALRLALAEAAKTVAKTIQYKGAGTVEFLVDDQNKFYFIEMNTRLQVEHPVTEAVTGLDLVEWQVRIAAGERLGPLAEQVNVQGHALECRIYAEDPDKQFMPSIGQISFLKEPVGEGVRLDTAIALGSTVSPYYDPMIAKLIVHGSDREQAIGRMQSALQQYAIGGIKTNIPFLQAILATKVFKQGDYTTHFLQEVTIDNVKPCLKEGLFFAAAYAYLDWQEKETDPLLRETMGFQLHLQSVWTLTYLIDTVVQSIEIMPCSPDQFVLRWQETLSTLRVYRSGQTLHIEEAGKQRRAMVVPQAETLLVFLNEGPLSIRKYNEVDGAAGQQDQVADLMAPMPSTVVAVLVKPQMRVKKGDPLLVLEAMKMEHTIHAPVDGLVTDIFYPLGAQVNEGAELIRLDAV